MRLALIVVSGTLFLAALIVLALGEPVGVSLTLVSGIIFIGTLFERFRYKKIDGHTGGDGWIQTSERFIDPETGKLVTVYYHPQSGERRYVADPRPL